MLPKKNRLRKKKDFEKVFKNGKGFKEDFLILKIKKNKIKELRFGFIVSQKVSKKAVVRNKVKRRLREAIKEIAKNISKKADIVLIALPGLETKDFQTIKKTIEKLFKKAGILNF
ncbi:MAG: ribonuclease P protein component [Candidatus Nealsonbacteria bacterium]